MQEKNPVLPGKLMSASNEIEAPKEIAASLIAVARRLMGFSVEDFRISELHGPSTHLLQNGGGKQIRAALILSSAVTLGLEPEKFVDLAVAIEMLQNASLIHDDMIDKDMERRGLPSVHAKFGEPAALLAGNANITKAIKYANRYGARVVDSASEAALDMCAGEILDHKFQLEGNVPTLDEYLEMVGYKTASLMGVAACMPAVYIGDESAERHLREIGYNMGLSFQIRDDILENQGLKKRETSDKRSQKFRPNIVSVFANHGKKDPLKTSIKLNNFYIARAKERLESLSNPKIFDGYLSFLELG